nr:predicted GPI-anchored protein 58 [Pelodiscus sinensis]|eukprot:XP_014429126.1 predicted GPI-anchored protein 58 [Pelodiscus sinensis]
MEKKAKGIHPPLPVRCNFLRTGFLAMCIFLGICAGALMGSFACVQCEESLHDVPPAWEHPSGQTKGPSSPASRLLTAANTSHTLLDCGEQTTAWGRSEAETTEKEQQQSSSEDYGPAGSAPAPGEVTKDRPSQASTRESAFSGQARQRKTRTQPSPAAPDSDPGSPPPNPS